MDGMQSFTAGPEISNRWYAHLMISIQSGTLCVTLLVVCMVTVLLWRRFLGHPPQWNLPPSPPGLPIIGHLHLLSSSSKPSHQILAGLAHKYGPLMLVRFGMKLTLVVSSTELAQECLKDHDAVFSGRPYLSIITYLTYNGQDIVMARRTDAKWRHLRKLMMIELLSNKRLDETKHIRDSEVAHMVRAIFHDSQTAQLTHFREKLFILTFNTVSRMALKKRFLNHESEGLLDTDAVQGGEFKAIVTEVFVVSGMICLGDCFPIFKNYDVQGCMSRMKAAHARLDMFFQKVLNEHRERRAQGVHIGEEDMVDVLLSSQEQVSDLNIKTLLLNAYLGSTESLMNVMEWAMTEILRNSSIKARAQFELDHVIGRNRTVREDDMPKLPYLGAIAAETLRLHPPGPMLMPHETTENCKISGYDVPANTQVFVNIWACARDPINWVNPLEFNPDRFLAESGVDPVYRGHDFRLIPFGAGRRICPAINLSIVIIQNVIANLLHSFEWTVNGTELDLSEMVAISAPKAVPLSATALARLPQELYRGGPAMRLPDTFP